MLMILMEFSFVPQTLFRIFFQDQDHDRDHDPTIKFSNKSYALNIKITHQIWWRSTKFFFKIEILFKIRIRIIILFWIPA